VVTARLELVPATVALCEAEQKGPAAVEAALGARVPASWPPPVYEPDDVDRVRRQLVAEPGTGSWTLHYVLRRGADEEPPALVGVAGFGGPPGADGVVEIGYAIAVEHQRQGYATEAVAALLELAFADARVRRVVATTYAELEPSIRVLRKAGFAETGRAAEGGVVRFERGRVNR